MSSLDQPLFYGCFRHLAARSDLELRQACASQLAAVVRAASALSASAYQSHFHDTVTLLAGDDADGVRASVAEQLHELARLAGKDAGAWVRPRVLVWGARRAEGRSRCWVVQGGHRAGEGGAATSAGVAR